MKRPEPGFGYSPLGDEGAAGLPGVTTGENTSEVPLDDEVLAREAKELMSNFKRALLEDPSYKDAAAGAMLSADDFRHSVRFTKNNIPYVVQYRESLVEARLEISRFPEGHPGRREHISIERGIFGEDDEWGSFQWGKMWEPGKEPDIHTNTPAAKEKVEAFLHDLQGTA